MAGRYKKGWSAVHQMVFKLYTEGYTPAEIVKKTNFGMDKVRNIIRTDKFQEHHDKVVTNSVETARKMLESKLTEAAGQIVRIMKHGKPEDRLRFDAAKEVLYQCGMKPVEVVETRNRDYTPEEIQSSLLVLKEVKEIEEKLSTQGSEFLLTKEDDISSPSAPVQTSNDEQKAPSDEGNSEIPTDEPLKISA